MADQKQVSEDVIFGSLVVKRNLATQQQVAQCLTEVKRRRKEGERISLADVMVAEGIVSSAQAKDILEFQRTKLTTCPNCHSIYNIEKLPQGKKIRCKKCRTIIVVQKDEGGEEKKEEKKPRKVVVSTFSVPTKKKEEKAAPPPVEEEEDVDIDLDDEDDLMDDDPDATAAFPIFTKEQAPTPQKVTDAKDEPTVDFQGMAEESSEVEVSVELEEESSEEMALSQGVTDSQDEPTVDFQGMAEESSEVEVSIELEEESSEEIAVPETVSRDEPTAPFRATLEESSEVEVGISAELEEESSEETLSVKEDEEDFESRGERTAEVSLSDVMVSTEKEEKTTEVSLEDVMESSGGQEEQPLTARLEAISPVELANQNMGREEESSSEEVEAVTAVEESSSSEEVEAVTAVEESSSSEEVEAVTVTEESGEELLTRGDEERSRKAEQILSTLEEAPEVEVAPEESEDLEAASVELSTEESSEEIEAEPPSQQEVEPEPEPAKEVETTPVAEAEEAEAPSQQEVETEPEEKREELKEESAPEALQEAEAAQKVEEAIEGEPVALGSQSLASVAEGTSKAQKPEEMALAQQVEPETEPSSEAPEAPRVGVQPSPSTGPAVSPELPKVASAPTLSPPFDVADWEKVEKAGRFLTVSYYDRLRLGRSFPVSWHITLQSHYLARLAWKLECRKAHWSNPSAATFRIVPHFPGCWIHPATFEVSTLAPVLDGEFWITPFDTQAPKKGRLEIWYGGKLVEALELPFEITSQAGTFGWSVLAGVSFVAPLAFPLFLPHTTAKIEAFLSQFEYWNRVVELLGMAGRIPILLGMVFVLLATWSYLRNALRRRQRGKRFSLIPSLDFLSLAPSEVTTKVLSDTATASSPLPPNQQQETVSLEVRTPAAEVERARAAETAASPTSEVKLQKEEPQPSTLSQEASPPQEVEADSPQEEIVDESSSETEAQAQEVETDREGIVDCGQDMEKFFQCAQEGVAAQVFATFHQISFVMYTTEEGEFYKQVLGIGENAPAVYFTDLPGKWMKRRYTKGEFSKDWLSDDLWQGHEAFEGELSKALSEIAPPDKAS